MVDLEVLNYFVAACFVVHFVVIVNSMDIVEEERSVFLRTGDRR